MLIHGFGGTYSGLEDLSDLLSAEHTVLGIDLPGYGLSEPLRERHTLANYARFLDHFCESTRYHKLTVVGHSFGADIALVFAAMYPNRIKKLVLLSPVISPDKGFGRLGKYYYHAIQGLPKNMRHRMLHNHALTLLSDHTLFHKATPEQKARILRDDYISDHLMSDRPILESYSSLVKTPFLKLATQITAPALIVSGASDNLSPLQDMELLQQAIPRSSLSILNNEGHFMPLESPARTYKEIIAFIE